MQVLCIGFFSFMCLFYLIHLFSDTSVLSIKTIQFNFLFCSCHQLYKEYVFLQSLWQNM